MPFSRLSEQKRRPTFYLLLVATLALGIWQGVLNAPLNTETYPLGIIGFELARTTSSAQAMIASWSSETISTVWLSLKLDFAFLLAYGLTLSLACFLLAKRLQPKSPGLSRVGKLLAWAQLAAALFDGIENLALMAVLAGWGDLWPLLAWAAALLKFSLVIAGLLFLVAGTVYSFTLSKRQ